MISITETTITITALVFIVILIILAKLSRQLDDILELTKQIRKKTADHEETTKWNSDIIKSKLDKIEKKSIVKNKDGINIQWKG